MSNERHPIKHVKFSDGDYSPTRSPEGFRERRTFKPVTQEFRQELVDSIAAVQSELDEKNGDIGVAVVILESKAIAKSHRPTGIFHDKTCELIGDIGFGRFLIKVDSQGLQKLSRRILQTQAKTIVPQISTIKSIEVFEPEIAVEAGSKTVNVRLFRFNSHQQNQLVDRSFEEYLTSQEIRWKKLSLASIRIYKVFDLQVEVLQDLSRFNAVARITTANTISFTPMVHPMGENSVIDVEPPIEDADYPVVGVVDSGVQIDCPHLSPWIVGVEQHILYKRNLFHGSFVSGLISNAYSLNGKDRKFPKSLSKIVSIEVLGEESGSPDDVIWGLEDAANKYPFIKVWNLSLGSSEPVSQSFISDLAVMLDEFQKKHDCLCVVAAGNYDNFGGTPRSWPPQELIQDDVISSPGDSTRSLTVGSIAHLDGHVNIHEPSHFSRRGPVSNFIQKPEVVHYGGNAVFDTPRPYILGVNSISAGCALAESIGTSFSTPLVSTIAANLFSKIGANANPLIVKSLIIHSASLNHDIEGDAKHYYGWGIPQDTDEILSNSDNEVTIVMEGLATKSFELQKLPFPIPESLRTSEGKVRGEFFMTLVYDPDLDPQKASEYCQVNLDVKLGKIDEEGFNSKVPLDIGGHEYEKDLVQKGGKWAPVKVYKKSFKRGIDVENWKLIVELMNREGYEPEGVMVPFALIITLRALDDEAPVYNEMVRLMDQQAWHVSDLVIESEIRV